MSAVLIVVPVFALIAAGYAAVALRFISATAHKGIAEFAFSIAIPALLFRIVVVAEFPAVSPFSVWGAYYGATAMTWIAALLVSSLLRQSRADGVALAIGSIYGNIVMLGLPLILSALGSQAAGSMALILTVNTPLLWLCGTLQMAWAERKSSESAPLLVIRAVREIAQNPIMLALGFGFLWRFTGLGLHPVADKTLELLAQAGSPTALIALGISLFGFRIKGQALAGRHVRAQAGGDAGGRRHPRILRSGPAADFGGGRGPVRGDADRRQCLHLLRPVRPAHRSRLGRRCARHDVGGGDAANHRVVADDRVALAARRPNPRSRTVLPDW